MRNRYGDEYSFLEVDKNIYAFVGNTNWCRFGGLEGQETVSLNNLGFFDPSGGPFLEVGGMLPGVNRKIKRIFSDNQVCFEVE